jgi:hypothetical protein
MAEKTDTGAPKFMAVASLVAKMVTEEDMKTIAKLVAKSRIRYKKRARNRCSTVTVYRGRNKNLKQELYR